MARSIIGAIPGYEAYEMDQTRVNGSIYAVMAAGPDGILGICMGGKRTGWNFEQPANSYKPGNK